MEATASSGSMVTEEAEGASYSCGTSELKKARLQSMLATLLDDPVLADVPRKPSLSNVDTLISLELGSAMKVSVIKMDNTSIEVAVMNSATVKELKVAIQKKMNETEEAQMGHRHISWRHVWANCYLEYYNEKLTDDNSLLQNFGIHNNSQEMELFLFSEYELVKDMGDLYELNSSLKMGCFQEDGGGLEIYKIPPKTLKELMEFLSRLRSVSTAKISKALAQKKKSDVADTKPDVVLKAFFPCTAALCSLCRFKIVPEALSKEETPILSWFKQEIVGL